MSATTDDPPPAASSHDAYYLDLWQRSGFALNPPEMRRWQWMRRAIRRHRPAAAPPRVLDYGCGSGRFLPLLGGLGLGTVVGFDVTRAVLEEVARRHPGAEIVVGDGSFPSPLPSAAFRLAISSEVIEHTDAQVEFVRDLARLLAPGGLLLLTTPNGRFEARYKAGTKGLQPIENWLDAAGLRGLLEDAGLRLAALTTDGAHWSNMPYQRWALYRLAKRLGRRCRVWSPFDRFEHWLAGRVGRGITLLAVARRVP